VAKPVLCQASLTHPLTWSSKAGVHVVFFAALGSIELFAPSLACTDALARPLTTAGVSITDQCASLPVARLVLFGVAKYHLLFCLISAVVAFGRWYVSVRRAVLVLHALYFASDVSWAAAHLSWIGAGPAALIPQSLLVLSNRCAFERSIAFQSV
jgi:hypothetical protein